MSSILKNYALAIVAGAIEQVAATLSPTIKVMPPAGNQPNEGKEKTSMMLSAVATAISDFRFVRSYEGEGGWHAVLLEGSLDGTPVQFIDQVHIGEDELVDHVDIFLRPTSMMENLLGKMATEIQKRTSK